MLIRYLLPRGGILVALLLSACGRSDPALNAAAPDRGPLAPPTSDAAPSDAGFSDVTDVVPSIASSYLINPAHTGYVDSPSLVPPLTRLWQREFGNRPSYALIANGRMYVITGSGSPDLGLTAFDPRTGATLWGPYDLYGTGRFNLYHFRAHAYDQGRVFTLNEDGHVHAFDAVTGASLWEADVPSAGQAEVGSAPTAYRGILYIASTNDVIALDEATGSQLWTQPLGAVGDGAPTVDDDGVYVIRGCRLPPTAYRFDPKSGARAYGFDSCASAGDEVTPSLYRGVLYGNFDHGNFDIATGYIKTYPTNLQPCAFHNGRRFTYDAQGELQAHDVANDSVVWFTYLTGGSELAPIGANGRIYVLTDSSTIRAFDEQTGTEVWSDANPGWTTPPKAGGLLSGLSAAEGYLVVPYSTGLAVYASSGGAGN